MRTIRNVVPLTIRDAVTPAIGHSAVNINAQDNRSLAQVIATTGLTTTQLVVTQQKQALGLPQLGTGMQQTPFADEYIIFFKKYYYYMVVITH